MLFFRKAGKSLLERIHCLAPQFGIIHQPHGVAAALVAAEEGNNLLIVCLGYRIRLAIAIAVKGNLFSRKSIDSPFLAGAIDNYHTLIRIGGHQIGQILLGLFLFEAVQIRHILIIKGILDDDPGIFDIVAFIVKNQDFPFLAFILSAGRNDIGFLWTFERIAQFLAGVHIAVLNLACIRSFLRLLLRLCRCLVLGINLLHTSSHKQNSHKT